MTGTPNTEQTKVLNLKISRILYPSRWMKKPGGRLKGQHTNTGPGIDDLEEILAKVNIYENITRVNPTSDRGWDTLGKLYKALGRYKDAIGAYQKAIEVAPDKEVYYYYLGLLFSVEQQNEEAIQAFQFVLRKNPDYVLAHSALAGVYHRMGLENKANHHISIALPKMNNESTYNRACFYVICGDHELAFEFLRLALTNKETTIDWIKSDPDLDPIRNDQRYHRINFRRKPSSTGTWQRKLFFIRVGRQAQQAPANIEPFLDEVNKMSITILLNVLLGLFLTWSLLSLASMQIQEWIATRLKWRSRMLEESLEKMLTDSTLVDQFYNHPLIRSLYTGKNNGNKPSYIPASQFSQAMIDILSSTGTEASLLQQQLYKLYSETQRLPKKKRIDARSRIGLMLGMIRKALVSETGEEACAEILDTVKNDLLVLGQDIPRTARFSRFPV